MHDEPQFQVGAVDVEQLLESLTLEQKVAQMIQGEIKHVTPEDMRIYGLGSVLNGGGSFPNDEKYASTQAWVDLADAYYKASIKSQKIMQAFPQFGVPMLSMVTTMLLVLLCFRTILG